ncbi:acyltransferase family protein [Acutalibacter sp. 1XD8-36]|uniref:acyltransferase family protein n=1 Tax=Acutalibacter sp. 1XD8-36 TaxID=2320852 RepID=UPI0026025D22|nr:acyltransferase [Acutalibacter sp. 1XD8-36]
MRIAYIDNLRAGTVWLVAAYHVCYLYNGVGILGNIPGSPNIPVMDAAASIVYPWFMVLLFTIAGISARYALSKRTAGQFIRERAVKLLVPSTLGLLTLHWVTGWLNIKLGGGLEYIPGPLVYPISVFSGTGPLWFIQMLFVFSCLLVLLRKLDKGDRLWRLGEKCGMTALAMLWLPIFLGAQVLNMPVLTMYRFGIYFIAFLIGYFILSHDSVQEKLSENCLPLAGAAVMFGIAYMILFHGKNFTEPQCLKSHVTNIYLWLAVLAIIGCGKKFLNRETRFTKLIVPSSYGIYILHYPVLLTTGYLLCTYLQLPAALNYLLTLLAGVIIPPALYWLIRRVPVIRWLVLGVKGQ